MKLRHEYKHRINMADRLILRRRLSAIAGHDINSNADGTYRVKSLYFDNYMDKALKEKCDGLRLREKFRIRCYNDDASFIRLEKKSKIGNMCSKESVIITQEQCMKILNGDIGFLKESSNNLMCEFYAKIRYQLLRPKCIVAYTRESFVYEPGNVRITLDYDICRSSNTKAFLAKDNIFIQPNKDCILEVKYDEFLPQIIRNAVQTTSRRAAAYSKYAAMRF
ncbi:MAG: polyphosphate polymerase domain-containing protein [Clostridia bacterium]|nr:polyphosphate polymerase domain-containing protein [Clostridia bacterium]